MKIVSITFKNGSMLYVMSIVKNVHRVNDKNAFGEGDLDSATGDRA